MAKIYDNGTTHDSKDTQVCVKRFRTFRPHLVPFRTLNEGDTVYVGGEPIPVTTRAHWFNNHGEDYGYQILSENKAYFPEDLDDDIITLLSEMGFDKKPMIPGAGFMDSIKLYRGQRLDNGEWVIGFVHYSKWSRLVTERPRKVEDISISYYIRPVFAQDAYEVEPATLCEYIGRRDDQQTDEYPEGRMMFDGDIIQFYNNADEPDNFELCEIVWDENNFRWAKRPIGKRELFSITLDCRCIVVGTRHDNTLW